MSCGVPTTMVLRLVLEYVSSRTDIARATRKTYRSMLIEFAQCVGPDLDARVLTRRHVETFVSRKMQAQSTRAHTLSVLRGFD